MFVGVRNSTLPGGGRGVFAELDIPRGTAVTVYRGRIIPPRDLVKLDTEGSDVMHYIISTALGPLCPVDIESEDVRCCGHKINDALCVENGASDSSSIENQIKAYQLASASTWNVLVECDNPRPVDGGTVECSVVTTRDVVRSEELFLKYGLPFWGSRCVSPLFWRPGASEADKQQARLFRSLLVAAGCAEDALPILPPHASVRVDPDGTNVLVCCETGKELSDDAVLLLALSMFNRDRSCYKLPPKALRVLLARAAAAAQE